MALADTDTLAALAGQPALQGLAVALSTFVLEDPVTVACGLLVADGRMAPATAFFGLWIGIALGDILLYAAGRLLGPGIAALRLLPPARIARAQAWFDRNLIVAVAGSRFVPGMRLPTYLAAGLFRAHPLRFIAAAVLASLVWTTLLLALTVGLGQAVFPLLGRWRWPAAAGAIALMLGASFVYRRRSRAAAPPEPAADPVVSVFEFWPPWLFYIPVGFYYAWLCLRYRSLTLPSAANPNIFSGGLIFETKTSILDGMPAPEREWIAPYAGFTPRAGAAPAALALEAEAAMRSAGIGYPIVAKPDRGQRGFGVAVVRGRAALEAYLAGFPAGAGLVLQALVPWDNELGVMVYRMPGERACHVYSVTRKYFPALEGDGRRTLRALMHADPRTNLLFNLYAQRLAQRLDEVVPEGERVPLVFAGNHAQGAVFRDGMDAMTGPLRARIEQLVLALPEFHFGRIDLRFESAEALARGEGFRIIEINGAGAEATHIWDARARLADAYRALFGQWRILFAIGGAMRRRGHRPMGARALLRACRDYRRLSQHYPASA